ncbi:MAG: ABC transporter permease [Candidatus Levybacteria bacterium]|nr:ABC transporter permease [Candidatus Levybacteria bacterium]
MKTFRTSWNHIRRSPYQALAAITIMTLTFLAISIFSIMTIGSTKIIAYFESKPQVTAFFKNEANQEDIDTLSEQMEQSQEVANVRFVSKQEALKIYREQNKNDPLLLDLVTSDILPASLEVSANRIEDLSPIADALKKSPIVSEVIFQKDVVQTLTSWTSALRKIGIGVIVLLSVVSVFIMATIIGFKISQKREEIEIMKLLSATNWYIRWPFLLEGIFYGLVGAFFGWLIAAVGLVYATPYLQSFLGSIPLLPVPMFFLLGLLGAEFIVAIILGTFSSFLAVLRYLK